MEHIGIDVHKSESQLCIITEVGEVVELRIRTERGRLLAEPAVELLAELEPTVATPRQ